MTTNTRRRFLTDAALGAGAVMVSTTSARGAESANEKIVVGVMGLSRGRSLATSFAKRPNVEVRYVCDVDSDRAGDCAELVAGAGSKKPQAVGDFRKILDDKAVDALVCAAPNHWHGPATIYGCQAGKHVYVEKPCSHNPAEGELMIAAARKNKRAVQVGTQRRSGPETIAAMKALADGAIGRVYAVNAFYNSARGSIGKGKSASPPARLDYDLWQGPAPRTRYLDNRVHYNWHWFWHWGNGELGNNGVHTLDLCRWGAQVDFPIRVTASGGRYCFDDDQQTPDTHHVSYEFDGGVSIHWRGLSCHRHGGGFVTFLGAEGALDLDSNGTHRIFDAANKQVKEVKGTSRGDIEHIDNFLAAIRNDQPLALNAEIAIGHRSTLLCHLGNIAQRTGETVQCNAADGHIQDNAGQQQLWQRDYETGWEPKV
ncbi:MAG: Gfo/Idh/MocA family oxidoreductase [Pirellulaceae bacterium]|jgi:predicted dehydrogenase|nr:Gfo/Idh/MocA family oxidoreductase [Pirellulaceae bacterium]MDP7016122.1 Gfo/Idh/MocA family oxidoreductase [Pirellulaceae bacterium]